MLSLCLPGLVQESQELLTCFEITDVTKYSVENLINRKIKTKNVNDLISKIYLLIKHRQTEVLDLKALPSGHYLSPPAPLPQPGKGVPMQLYITAKIYCSLFLNSSLTMNTFFMYSTWSESLSRDFPSLR